MRDFIFRSWDPVNKKMLYDFDQHIDAPIRLGDSIHNYVYSIGLAYKTLMQYTGLKDKNEKEIYEGDICKCHGFIPENQEVKFIEGGFCLYWGDDAYPNDINLFYPSTGCQLEVIGNIKENPELLSHA